MRKLPLLVLLPLLLASSGASLQVNEKFTGLDCHIHVHPDGEDVPWDGNRVLLALDSAGLSHGCILSQGYQKRHDDSLAQREFTISRNTWTLGEAKKHPRLIPFCGVPFGEPWAAEEVKRCVETGARGLKLHQSSEKISLKSEAGVASLIQVLRAAAGRLVVLIHVIQNDPGEIDAFYKLASEFPATTFIVAHNLGQNAKKLHQAPPNVFVELSGIVMAPLDKGGAHFTPIWRQMGIERVIFGSDWPVFHPAEHLHFIKNYPLTEVEKDKIVRKNALRIFPKLGQ